MTTNANLRVATLLFALLLYSLAASAQAAVPSGMLGGEDPSLAPMLDNALPAVVNVVVTGKAQQMPDNPLFNDPFFRRFFDMPDQQQRRAPQRPTAAGSGVIVDADKGIVITNHHVVKDAEEITVRLNDDREYEAELIGDDPETDIAVIQIDADNLTELPIADSDKLRVGDFVVAIGNPFGLRQTVTSGIVSGLGRHGLGNRYEDFIQTDASINPGNSGGALVNLEGELVGINSAILSRTGGNIGIGFAIPSNLVNSVYQQLSEYGEVKRGRLGVVGQNLTDDLAKAFDLDINQGVVVAQVMPDSPAAKAGIRERDVITQVNGKEITDFSQLANAIGLKSPGEKVRITLMRDGEEREIKATLGNAENMATNAQRGDDGQQKLAEGLDGASFGPITDDNPLAGEVEGVAVTDVQPGSPAARAGLRPGDIITSINRQEISDVSQLPDMAGPDAQQLLLHVRRGRGALFLLIR
ncbi:peptidase [Salinisphaera orenii MK-B5]|uniref:Peptidase n=1 Tax=Salinisphaera orenii MK-B5 TaxID=856730 RepID=A0A423PUB3_9GAMM|nr:DegQ family serine endoprotease [Salinisphaera orenii]ROO29196.1 peptidase [Salinisphaera orenii MK-B5]